MSIESLIALMGFTLVVSITPGPGNLMLLSSGAAFGFKQSIPLVLGICTGFMSLILLVGLGMEQIFNAYPSLFSALKVVCVLYVLKLALKISRSAQPAGKLTAATDKSTATDQLDSPVTLVQGAIFQLVSPKAWMVTPILIVTYTNPENYLMSLLVMLPVCAAVNIPSTSVWALFGVSLRRMLAVGNRSVYFNHAMALLLLASLVPVIAD
ncbi:MAG: LysE family translocator [Granulosicoccus sp.]|nr:LysE family translocator [Granulosicoccus sp.]